MYISNDDFKYTLDFLINQFSIDISVYDCNQGQEQQHNL